MSALILALLMQLAIQPSSHLAIQPACQPRLSASLQRTIDGDTFVLRVELGFDVLTRATIRLADLDAAERNTPEGRKAAAAVDAFLKSGLITITATGDRTFARWVAHVYVDGQSVAAWLREHGHEKRR